MPGNTQANCPRKRLKTAIHESLMKFETMNFTFWPADDSNHQPLLCRVPFYIWKAVMSCPHLSRCCAESAQSLSLGCTLFTMEQPDWPMPTRPPPTPPSLGPTELWEACAPRQSFGPDWRTRDCVTSWLDRNWKRILHSSEKSAEPAPPLHDPDRRDIVPRHLGSCASAFRRGGLCG